MKKALPLSLSTILILNSLNGMAFVASSNGNAGEPMVQKQGTGGSDEQVGHKLLQGLQADLMAGTEQTIKDVNGKIEFLRNLKDSIENEKDPILRNTTAIRFLLDGFTGLVNQGGEVGSSLRKYKGLSVAAASVLNVSVDLYKSFKNSDAGNITAKLESMSKAIQDAQDAITKSPADVVDRDLVMLTKKFSDISQQINALKESGKTVSNFDLVNMATNLVVFVNSVAHIVAPQAAKVADQAVASTAKVVQLLKATKTSLGNASRHGATTLTARGGSIGNLVAIAFGVSDENVQQKLESAKIQLQSAIDSYDAIVRNLEVRKSVSQQKN